MLALRLVSAVLALTLIAVGCGDDDDAASTTTEPSATTAPSAPSTTAGTAESTSTDSAPTSTEASTPTSPTSPAGRLVARDDGLNVVSFGDEAEGAIDVLTGVLGPPDLDTGWQDPTDSANVPLWPGCPGSTARLLQWTDNLGAVFTDWDGDLSSPGATVSDPYFAGYGLWQASPLRTAEGAAPGLTLAEVRTIYGDRLFVSSEPDEAVGLYWFAIDGSGNPLSRTGGLRGWLFPPGQLDGDQTDPQATEPADDWVIGALTAGVSCSTP